MHINVKKASETVTLKSGVTVTWNCTVDPLSTSPAHTDLTLKGNDMSKCLSHSSGNSIVNVLKVDPVTLQFLNLPELALKLRSIAEK